MEGLKEIYTTTPGMANMTILCDVNNAEKFVLIDWESNQWVSVYQKLPNGKWHFRFFVINMEPREYFEQYLFKTYLKPDGDFNYDKETRMLNCSLASLKI